MYTFTKLDDRRIPKVRVGVGAGPMEFQLDKSYVLDSRNVEYDTTNRICYEEVADILVTHIKRMLR